MDQLCLSVLQGFSQVRDITATFGINAALRIQQLRALRAPTLWSIDLTVANAISNTLFGVYDNFFPRENGQNKKLLEVRHFRMMMTMAADGYQARKY